MNSNLLNIAIGLVGFSLFVVIQSLVINGIYECFKGSCTDDINRGKVCGGNIFYKISPSFFERNKGKNWALPIFGCVKCMSSFHSLWTYWPVVIYFFGFQPVEIFVWVIDMFVLVTLNWWIYKKL